ncbi:MAG: 30S ribosomal protein S14 [Magnetovibrio sp.]|nr:30S ribosomal protein S14 [Magnetovibrio sp.]|tara:strand:- start:22 stop:327 length:306 start_codon:yes stop_codon:yes gene_type:complete
MAKKSAVERDRKRVYLGKKFQARRARLKASAIDPALSPEERFKARIKLSEVPRNSAQVRQRLRCRVSGRSRGNYRKFGLSRIVLRELASSGQIPGIIKSSW